VRKEAVPVAKHRQARFTTQDLEGRPELEDESASLWGEEHGEVARSLLTSAVRCFASNGYHATTTRDISGAAGLSPAAMYVYFATKEHVLFEVIRAGHLRVLEYLTDPAVDEIADPAVKLTTIVARYTEWHGRHHVAARVSQFELSGLTAEHYDEILQLRHQTNDIFRAAVALGVDDGTFDPVDVKRVARAMLSLGIDLARWYRLDGSDSPQQLGEFNAELALRLVMSRPPSEDH
jgi:AcrR family transcriptional regulator